MKTLILLVPLLIYLKKIQVICLSRQSSQTEKFQQALKTSAQTQAQAYSSYTLFMNMWQGFAPICNPNN
jgi:hypothetical protein